MIGGMTYGTYDADNDPRGEIGHALANAKYMSCGISDDTRDWAGIARAALSSTPGNTDTNYIPDRDVRGKLRLVRDAGYDVPAYSGMSSGQRYGLLRRIQRDVAANALARCPVVFDEIDDANAEASRAARDELS